jgi:hypothetical protein
MANIYYTGKAVGVQQVSTVDIGTNDSATTYSLTINGVSVSVTGAANAEATATALVDAWNASTHPYFSGITAAVDSSASPSVTITLTGDDTDGMPFTVTASASGGTGSVGTLSVTTAATGPHHFDAADNWDLGRVPDNGDTVYITKSGARICWNIDRSGESPTQTWARLVVRGDVQIGLSFVGAATSADGDTVSAIAPEYRDQYLKVAITKVDILPFTTVEVDTGSARMHINNIASGASTHTVKASAVTSADTSRPAICFLAASASAEFFVESARAGVGVAVGNPGETSTINRIVLVDSTGVSQVFQGEGVTASSFVQNGGSSEIDAAATHPAITVNGGTCKVQGTQAVTAMTANAGGSIISNTTGTITTLTQADGSVLDFLQNAVSRTVTNYNFNGGQRKMDAGVLTITNDNRSGRITETIN